jgi:hypothetical protein
LIESTPIYVSETTEPVTRPGDLGELALRHDLWGDPDATPVPLPSLQPTHVTLAPPRRRDRRGLAIVAVASAALCAGAALDALVQSAPGPRDVSASARTGAANARAAATPPPAPGAEESRLAENLDAVSEHDLSAATSVVAEAPPPSQPVAHYDEVVLKQVVRWALRNAGECHKEGRAVGTAELFITFEPSGKVSEARLVGEPVASAPVARCVLDYARTIMLPPFEGPAFTVSRTLTLR